MTTEILIEEIERKITACELLLNDKNIDEFGKIVYRSKIQAYTDSLETIKSHL